MKIRIVKIYEDENDTDYIFIEADLYKSKHQPLPDKRVINRVKKEEAYKKSPAKSVKDKEYISSMDMEIEIKEIGAFNITYWYIYMMIQNIINRLYI